MQRFSAHVALALPPKTRQERKTALSDMYLKHCRFCAVKLIEPRPCQTRSSNVSRV